MIPRRAFFYWDQGWDAAPWERKISVETFKRHNPDWQVDLFSNDGYPGDTPQHRSDYFRYKELEENGGYYFDTDIVFVDSVPDSVLDCDVALPLSNTLRCHHIAMLGSKPGHGFFGELVKAAGERVNSIGYCVSDYQILGVSLVNRTFHKELGLSERPHGHFPVEEMVSRIARRFGGTALALDIDYVLPVWCDEAQMFFGSAGAWPKKWFKETTFGFHWYAGHPDSWKFTGGLPTRIGALCEIEGLQRP